MRNQNQDRPPPGRNGHPEFFARKWSGGLTRCQAAATPTRCVDLNYGCGSSLNWDGYCNPEIDDLIDQQSREGDPERRKRVLWTIERKLAEDVARPIIFYTRDATCLQPWVKGLTIMVNSIFNGWRMEDVWLDK